MKRYNRIKVILAEKELTRKDLQKMLKSIEGKQTDINTISRWISNKQQPHISKIYTIAKLLDCDIYDLLRPLKDI